MPRKWTREHEAHVARILELMRVEARAFSDDSPAAVAARKALPFDAWLRTYLPHYAYCPAAPAHILADDLVEERGIPVGLQWFRGAAKSVRYVTGKRLHRILNRLVHFAIVAARDEEVATDKMDMIRLELENNPRLRADYGNDIAPRIGHAEDSDWIACGVRVWARGIGQSPRGALHGPHRPDDFVADDIEDDVLARNARREDQLEEWLFGQMFPALQGAGVDAHFLVLLNMYGRNCLSVRMRDKAKVLDTTGRPICRYHVFPAETDDGRSAWPEKYSIESLTRARAIMGGRLYRREMMCLEDDESAAFRPDWIREFTSARFNRADASVVAYCDPSAKAAETNDFKAIVVLARPQNSEETYCLHAWIRHASPLEMLDHLRYVAQTWRPARIGCEANGFQSLLWPLMQSRHGAGAPAMFPVTNTTSKLDRIIANAPAFERGLCHFDPNEGDQKLLINQFLDLGKASVHDDGPDAWDGAEDLLPRLASLGGFSYRGQSREDRSSLFGVARRAGESTRSIRSPGSTLEARHALA